MPVDLEQIRAAIAESGAYWEAGEGPLTGLTEEQLRRRLGYRPGPDEPSLQERERLSAQQRVQWEQQRAAGAAPTYPTTWDWRNVPPNADNFVTEIKDQGDCGSCVAFAVTGAMDVLARVVEDLPLNGPRAALLEDLSEEQLFACGHGSCTDGWEIPDALQFAQSTGVVPYDCMPYTETDTPCNPCPCWNDVITQIKSWHSTDDITAMKQFLSTTGPLVAGFTVYLDFVFYLTGCYSHLAGPELGGHAVTVIGYDDEKGCWLCRNSWGKRFGLDGGYFQIEYGQCGIDAEMWAIDSFATVYQATASAETPLSSYRWSRDKTQHVLYHATEGHVHELWARKGDKWTNRDLTDSARSDLPMTTSPLASYAWEQDRSQHVLFQTPGGHIEELWAQQGGPWRYNDLTTAVSDAPAPANPTDVTAYTWPENRTQHVVYLDAGGNAVELWAMQTASWTFNKITENAGAPPAAGGSHLASYVWKGDGTQHVVYLDSKSEAIELWNSPGSGWTWNNLTQHSGAPAALAGSPLTAYAWEADSSQHVFYLSAAGDLVEVWMRSGDTWEFNVVNTAASSPKPMTGTPLTSYVFVKDDSEHVVYLGSPDEHVIECWAERGDGWTYTDITQASGAPVPSATELTSYAWDDDDTQHVICLTGAADVTELWNKPGYGWQAHLLT
jgi:hypothetical protein